MSSSKRCGAVRPGGGLVVVGAGLEAAVEDADEPVGELAQRSVVAGAAGTELVVVGASTGRGVQRGERLVINASMSRSLWTYRAATILVLPDVRVIGLVPA